MTIEKMHEYFKDMEKKLEDVRKEAAKSVNRTLSEYEKARSSLMISPIPYQRGARPGAGPG